MADLSSGPTTRVIAGCLYVRSDKPYGWDLRVHDLGHGHVEAMAVPRYGWAEVGLLEDAAAEGYAECLKTPPQLSQVELLDKALENRERSTRRAKTMVRRLCKHKGLTTLLTLTYQENMLDRDRMARDFDVFIKRVRRVIPDFQYVCVFERQKRGAWHAHIATWRVLSHYMAGGVMVKSYDLLRSLWRATIGGGGNIDVSRNKAVQRSSAKLASYLSKYIGKTFDQAEKYVNSYSSSGRTLPKPVVERVLGDGPISAIASLFELLGPEMSKECEFHHALLDGGTYFMCLSPPDRGKVPRPYTNGPFGPREAR